MIDSPCHFITSCGDSDQFISFGKHGDFAIQDGQQCFQTNIEALLAAFGEGFAGGYSVLCILGAGLVVRSLAGQSAELLITAGRQKELLVSTITAVVFNVALSVLLVPYYGIEGAAVATALAMAVRAAMLCLSVQRTLNLTVVALGLPSLRFSAAT